MKTIFDELQQEVKNWWISLILGILYVYKFGESLQEKRKFAFWFWSCFRAAYHFY